MQIHDVFPNLTRYLDAVEQKIKTFEESLYFLLDPGSEKIQFVMTRGKKLRAALLLICAGGAIDHPDTIELAVTIELLHYASLIHDDILDDEQVRRGEMPLYKQLGIKKSLLIGDYIIARSSLGIPVNHHYEISRNLVQLITEMCQGELTQLRLKDQLYLVADYQKLFFQVIRQKTALMFSSACYIGGIINPLQNNNSQYHQQFGESIGLAFQLIDDAMEIKSGVYGNNTPDQSTDLNNASYTLPYFIYMNKMDPTSTLPVRLWYAEKMKAFKNYPELHAEMNKAGVFQSAHQIISTYLNEAQQLIGQLAITQHIEYLRKTISFLETANKQLLN